MDRERLLAIFAEEFADRRRELERGLLELAEEQAEHPRHEVIRDLFRSAHSLKGAAQSVGATEVAAIAHQLEDAFAQLRDGQAGSQPPDPGSLLATLDRLDRAHDGVAAGSPRDAGPGSEGPGPAASGEPGAGLLVPAGPPVAPRARVSVVDLEIAIGRSGELRLAAQQVTATQRQVAATTSAIRDLSEQWQQARGELTANGAAGSPSVRAGADRFDEALERLRLLATDVEQRMSEADRQLERSVHLVAESVQQLGTVHLREVCAGLDRAVRDIAAASAKSARLELPAADLELDRSVATALREPLLHLVRNAVDHGIEAPGVREASGKAPTGVVRVTGEVRSGEVVVTVSDDGAGIDLDAVRQAARRRGIDAPDDDADVVRLLFTAGLSTSTAVTDVSGRGVGLDVVRGEVEAVGGTVQLGRSPDGGTAVTLVLPLTLSTMRAVLVSVGGEWVAVPVAAVERVVSVVADDVVRVGGRDAITVGDRSVVLADLGTWLGFASSTGAGDGLVALVVRTTEGSVAFVVDEVEGEREVTLRKLGPRLRDAPGVLGGLVQPDGTCGFLLHAATWVRRALHEAGPAAEGLWGEAPPPSTHVLLAEDTLTTRALERSILEAAGHRVTVAADGAEAWRLLQRHGADLVVTDVDMPEMNGLELCERIRSSTRFADLPVVLVTSLADERDRARGMEVGASAYFVKSAFDQSTLLDTIARLL